jgi:hypothetical protein
MGHLLGSWPTLGHTRLLSGSFVGRDQEPSRHHTRRCRYPCRCTPGCHWIGGIALRSCITLASSRTGSGQVQLGEGVVFTLNEGRGFLVVPGSPITHTRPGPAPYPNRSQPVTTTQTLPSLWSQSKPQNPTPNVEESKRKSNPNWHIRRCF